MTWLNYVQNLSLFGSRILIKVIPEQAGLSLSWSDTSKTGFLVSGLVAAEYFQRLFQYTADIHERALRSTSENLLCVPNPNIEQFRNSIS